MCKYTQRYLYIYIYSYTDIYSIDLYMYILMYIHIYLCYTVYVLVRSIIQLLLETIIPVFWLRKCGMHK